VNSEAPAKAAATATVGNAIKDWLAESLMPQIYIYWLNYKMYEVSKSFQLWFFSIILGAESPLLHHSLAISP